MMSNLVTMVEDQTHGSRVILDAPTGHKEGLAEIMALERRNDARDRHFRPVAQQG
jgi:hypothetical protein